jgi:hypothetical protein
MAQSGKRQRRLSDGYSFRGFRAQATVHGVFGDRDVRIVTLDRRSKKCLRLLRPGADGLVRSGEATGSGPFEFWVSHRDEIAIRKGHNYRIVVSDLVRKRPIPGSSPGTCLVRR